MDFDSQLAQFYKNSLSIRIEVSLCSAQNDKDKERGASIKTREQ